MASKVQIVNMALVKLGIKAINDINESSEPARRANIIWDDTRKAVLRNHPWGFATKIKSLNELATDIVPGWSYVYEYPSDCLFARKIIDGSTGQIIWDSNNASTKLTNYPFRKLLSSVGNYLILATNIPNASLEYTANVTDTTLFDPSFIDTFSFRLAADLAQTLVGMKEKGTEMMELYLRSLDLAKVDDRSESYQPRSTETNSPYLECR